MHVYVWIRMHMNTSHSVEKQDKAESMRVTSVQCHIKVFITRQREDRRVHYKTKTACSLPVGFFRQSHKMLSGKVWLCLDDSRFAGHWIIPRIFISLDEAKSFKRRNFAHLSVHSPNICQWYVYCSFQLVLKIYFIVESTLHDTLGGVIQSYTRSGEQKQRGERRF